MSELKARVVQWGDVDHAVINSTDRSGFIVDCPLEHVPAAIAALRALLREQAAKATELADAADAADTEQAELLVDTRA